MDVNDTPYYVTYPDCLNVVAQIDWTLPTTHDVLFSGLLEQNATAFFYAIVARQKRRWVTYYIGKVFAQTAAQRHRAPDHVARLNELQAENPGVFFHLTLGTPTFVEGMGVPKAQIIDDLEGLLIYANWSESMVNKRRTDTFSCSRQIVVENTGFIEHIRKRTAYGVFSDSPYC